MSNVRFYRLETLPSFEVPKHQGIFVHVTGTMYNTPWDDLSDKENPIRIDPKNLLITTPDIFLDKWLEKRHITQIESGLWFGGENGWELLSNETNSAAINAAIVAKIQELHVDGYAQAEMSGDGTTLTIKGIQEVDGKIGIPNSDNLNLNIAIDGGYNKDTNKIATQSTVTTAINGLNAGTIQAVTFNTPENGGNTTLTFNGVKEANGVIAQGDGAETFIVGDAKLNIQIGSDESGALEVFSANAKANGTIKLDGNVFKKNGDVFGIYTTDGVSSSNPLVTQKDIASLGGAMHYKGPINDPSNWPNTDTVKAGDVYISTVNRNFIYNGQQPSIEPGDMIVFNTDGDNSKYTVIQSNITLGTGDGQFAANVGALADGKLVVGVNPENGSKGIKTVDFDVTNLTGTTGKNERTLTYTNGDADTTGDITLYHDVTITDALTVIGKPFTKSIKISSANRSIEITRNAGENNSTGVVVDLVWNTSMDPDNQL